MLLHFEACGNAQERIFLDLVLNRTVSVASGIFSGIPLANQSTYPAAAIGIWLLLTEMRGHCPCSSKQRDLSGPVKGDELC